MTLSKPNEDEIDTIMNILAEIVKKIPFCGRFTSSAEAAALLARIQQSEGEHTDEP